MNQGAGHLFPGARGMGHGPPMLEAPSTITGTSIRRPMRAPHLGTARSTKVVEGNTDGPRRQRDKEKW